MCLLKWNEFEDLETRFILYYLVLLCVIRHFQSSLCVATQVDSLVCCFTWVWFHPMDHTQQGSLHQLK